MLSEAFTNPLSSRRPRSFTECPTNVCHPFVVSRTASRVSVTPLQTRGQTDKGYHIPSREVCSLRCQNRNAFASSPAGLSVPVHPACPNIYIYIYEPYRRQRKHTPSIEFVTQVSIVRHQSRRAQRSTSPVACKSHQAYVAVAKQVTTATQPSTCCNHMVFTVSLFSPRRTCPPENTMSSP